MQSKTNNWSRITQFLHLGLAVTVTLQLLLSLVMEMPKPGEPANKLPFEFFEAHEIVGLTALAFVLMHWIWLFFAHDISFSKLFPYNGRGIRQVFDDVTNILHRRLPEGGPNSGGLVGLIHGLGFLAVTGMVITGGTIFYFISSNQIGTSTGHTIVEVHTFIANFVWVYWIGHVLMAVAHHLVGENTLRAMFNFRA